MVWKRGDAVLSPKGSGLWPRNAPQDRAERVAARARRPFMHLCLLFVVLIVMVPLAVADPQIQNCGGNFVHGHILVPSGPVQAAVVDRTDHPWTNFYIPKVGQERYTMFWDTSDGLGLQSYGVSFWRSDGSMFAHKVGGPHVPSSGETLSIPPNTNLVIVWLRTGPEMPLNGADPVFSEFGMLLEGCRTK